MSDAYRSTEKIRNKECRRIADIEMNNKKEQIEGQSHTRRVRRFDSKKRNPYHDDNTKGCRCRPRMRQRFHRATKTHTNTY